MDEKVYFRLSYETMTGDTDAEIARARSTIELWYCLALAGRAPDDVADRDHLRFTEMLLRAPTAEQRACQL